MVNARSDSQRAAGLAAPPPIRECVPFTTRRGDRGEEGYLYRNVLASYIHLHFASDPRLAGAFVDRGEAFRSGATPFSSVGER